MTGVLSPAASEESGPVVATRSVPVDLDELASAIEDGSGEHAWYLDRQTGELHLSTEGGDEEALPLPREELERADRYVLVTPEEPGVAYRDMVDFAESVYGRELRTRLTDALAGKGAFGRFRRVLADVPRERERWFSFRAGRLRDRALEWLAGAGLQVAAKGRPSDS